MILIDDLYKYVTEREGSVMCIPRLQKLGRQ